MKQRNRPNSKICHTSRCLLSAYYLSTTNSSLVIEYQYLVARLLLAVLLPGGTPMDYTNTTVVVVE